MVVHINTYSNRATKWKAPLCSDTSNSNKLTHSFSALFPFCIEFHLTFFFILTLALVSFFLSFIHPFIRFTHSLAFHPFKWSHNFLVWLTWCYRFPPFHFILTFSIFTNIFWISFRFVFGWVFECALFVMFVWEINQKKNSHLCIVYGTRYRNVWSAFLSEVISMFKFI